MAAPVAVARYRFSEFVLSPRRRVLLRGDAEQPLIPRYFDLLVFLVEHRDEAVHRRDIFDKVWRDVIVSDSALSQAIRTIRRTLGDDSREPRFIATVSRHGYRFVFDGVVQEDDDADWRPAEPVDERVVPVSPASDAYEPLLARLTAEISDDGDQRREAAELLHSLGTAEALVRLGTRPGHAGARALLRDARWEVAGAGPVPILGAPAPIAAAWELAKLRGRRAARLVARRWAAASVGAGVAGVVGGAVGGVLLAAAPGSQAPLAVAPVLALIGGACGATAGAGVAAGLAVAEALARSWRVALLAGGSALGGGLVGSAVQWLSRWSLAALVGLQVEIGGGLDGLVLGAAVGMGYALGTDSVLGGLAAPRGVARMRVVTAIAIACGLASVFLTLTGRPLVGGTIHAIAAAASGSQMLLTPLARLIGEPDFGPVTGTLIGAGEGMLFGAGLALGLTRRPKI